MDEAGAALGAASHLRLTDGQASWTNLPRIIGSCTRTREVVSLVT